MSCPRLQLALIVAAVACVPANATASTAVDTLTIGSTAAQAGSIAHVPVYIRDAAGTALDAGTSAHIQSIAFRAVFTKPELVDGCSTTTFPDCQISFTPAGVLANLQSSQESISTGANSIDVRYVYDRNSQPIAFTLDRTAPGDLIGTIDVSIVSSAAEGAVLTFTIDESAQTTALSDNPVPFGGTVSETVNDGLAVTGGTLTIVSPHCANAPDRGELMISWSGACTAPSSTCPSGASITFTADASQYAFENCDTVSWNFGDAFTATGRTVSHAFAQGGMYDVVMTVTNPAGSAEAPPQQFTIPDIAGTCPALSASDFVVVTTPDCSSSCPSGTTIGFTVDPAGSYSFECGSHSFVWNFDDGSSFASGRSVLHTFGSERTYYVAVKVTSAVGSVTVTKPVRIASGTAGGGGCPLPSTSNIFMGWAGSCSAPNSICPAGSPIFFGPVFFEFPTSGCPYTVSWTFGDGTSVTGSPTHVFTTPGSYNVSMILTNPIGSVTISHQFLIQSVPRRRAVRE